MVAKKLDFINIVDVECTTEEGVNHRNTDPSKGFISEIIEVGIVTVDTQKKQIVDKDSIIVKPCYSKVTDFCTFITGYKQEDVDRGIAFAEAGELLRKKFKTRDRVWCSFGDFDREMFEKMRVLYQTQHIFGKGHINIKPMMAIKLGLPKMMGLARCLKEADILPEGKAHIGMWDAYNTAKLFIKLFL